MPPSAGVVQRSTAAHTCPADAQAGRVLPSLHCLGQSQRSAFTTWVHSMSSREDSKMSRTGMRSTRARSHSTCRPQGAGGHQTRAKRPGRSSWARLSSSTDDESPSLGPWGGSWWRRAHPARKAGAVCAVQTCRLAWSKSKSRLAKKTSAPARAASTSARRGPACGRGAAPPGWTHRPEHCAQNSLHRRRGVRTSGCMSGGSASAGAILPLPQPTQVSVAENAQ